MEDRKMFEGDWKCSGCGTAITSLPFDPKSTANLTCRDCHSKKKATQDGPRKKFQGNWSCSSCGSAITELPFEPKSTNNLTCRDCYMKNRG